MICIHSQFELELQFGSEEWDDLAPEALNQEEGLTIEDLDSFLVTLDHALLSLTPDGTSAIGMASIHPATTCVPACREHLYLKDNGEINAAAGLTTQVEYDGMTARLRLHAFVIPGVHKVKIAIADRDKPNNKSWRAKYDSALFIRSNSIRTCVPTQ